MIVIKSKALRGVLRYLIPFVLIPAVAIVGSLVFEQRRHMIVSLSIAVLALVLFVAGFERRMTGTRRMVLVAVVIALCIVGRFIPFFKPVTALTVIAAIYLGGESGFLIGALSALLSNFYFGQGPWTPFQMLAWGLVGLFAGLFAAPLKKSKIALLAYGVLSGALFSVVMDVWTVLGSADAFSMTAYLAALVTALPHMLMYSISNVVFLWLLSKPLGEKLERIKVKYGV